MRDLAWGAVVKLGEKEIKSRIEKGEITAISLDTSVFDNFGIKLEAGLLRQLEQFSGGLTKFVISDVVANESLSHLIKKTEDALKSINAGISSAKEFFLLDESALPDIRNTLANGRTPEAMATERLRRFEHATSLDVINAHEYVATSELLDMYFKNKPPFAESGTKKNEFPDAFALMSLESWAKNKDTIVLVVTRDKDWARYCENAEHLVAVSELGVALGYFQLESVGYSISKALSDKYEKGELKNIVAAINNKLERWVEDDGIYIEECSSWSYELDSTYATLENFEFQPMSWTIDEKPIIFRSIRLDKDELVLECNVQVNAEVTADYSFFTKDEGDYVPMGDNSITDDVLLEDIEVLITVSISKVDSDEEPEILDVEIATSSVKHDLGEVEPSWMHEE